MHTLMYALIRDADETKETRVVPTKDRANRVSDAYCRLKAEICSNRLPPDFRATEPEMAARLGMSRTPVREAMIRLEVEGLVELVPRRGMRVLPIRADDMRDIYEILTALEPDAAAALARRRPDAQTLAPLSRAMAAMEEALEAEDLDRWAEADNAYHQTLLALHGNRRLSAIVAGMYEQAHRARIFTVRLRPLPIRSTEEHRAILHHLMQGDGDAVFALFRDHRRRAGAELVEILTRYNITQV